MNSAVVGPVVLAVHKSTSHNFSKYPEDSINLIEGIGVEGDAHSGTTVKHRSRVARDHSQPNLRQVHLLHAELFDELMDQDHPVFPGDMGENITTRGIDLLALPTGTRLHIGEGGAVLELTGLRNPCSQIDKFQKGLMAAVLGRDGQGMLVRKAGVMAVVLVGGPATPGDAIRIEATTQSPPHPLQPV